MAGRVLFMEYMTVLFFAAGAFLSALVTYLLFKIKIARQYTDRQTHQVLLDKLQQLNTDNVQLQAEKNFLQEKLELQEKTFENVGQKMNMEFRLLANSILDEKSKAFNDQQAIHLDAALKPLKEHIQVFRQQMETRYNDETRERASLRTEIKHMYDLNQRLTKEAESLTNALKGSTKQQGDWGETILESILEYVGFQKGIHYTIQESSYNEDQKLIRPDVIVNYPDKRYLVIDSKVSLIHYERLCAVEDKQMQQEYQAMLLASVRAHIDTLSKKRYHDREGALDCVMMFIPVEGAFITALQAAPDLWQYAYDRKIILLSPTILLSSMKLVNDFWKRDNETKNARDIAKKAGGLYDKLVGFVNNMEDVGKYIDRAKDSWSEAFKQLHTGKANLVKQAEEMKQMHINASKSLPSRLVNEAQQDDSDLIG